ncbi:DoxX family protein [Chitinophaga sp. Cy-1792]|uniref:DoxX family protein n=1 Tax=Chitinophaga sp. Cy-1792 TaxID=2608339 RepID=UPI00142319E4|nr:DoxX family protein [Chitinophaga sp. Cy-1792]NIG55184.1 DoxX family protein [Chitinophaga sp. Cy-1792]
MKIVLLLGRILFALIFVFSGFNHALGAGIDYAAAAGVPAAAFLVRVAGVLALAGGLSVLLGFKARTGAILLVIFLVPVTLYMHKFWGITDPAAAQMQMAMFMKNVALTGACLIIAYFGSGPASIDKQA